MSVSVNPLILASSCSRAGGSQPESGLHPVVLSGGFPSDAAWLDHCLGRIRDPEGEGARTYIRLFECEARQAALAADRARASGVTVSPISGMPVSVKDLFDIRGSLTTAGSLAMQDEPKAGADALVVARLRAAGAVIVGTTNMTEFAMGALGINPHFGTPMNPFDRATGRIPGGSSSGAAVSVTDGMAAVAIGSDTAGSIRVPAALCGLVGFKPTARRVPLEGTVPLAPSLDSIGPLARNVATCAAVDAVIAADDTSLAPARLSGLRLAAPRALVLDGLEPAVAEAYARCLTALSQAGAAVTDVELAELAEVPAFNANSRFSMVEGYAWHRDRLVRSGLLYDPMVVRRLEGGAATTDAEYREMLAERRALIARCDNALQGFDAVLMPTVPITAPPVTALAGDEAAWMTTNRLLLRNPMVANVLDLCAVSLPCHRRGAAPVGLSLMGRRLQDRALLGFAVAVERVLETLRRT